MKLRNLLATALIAALPLPAAAQTTGDARLVFVGADPAEGLAGPVSGPLSVLALPALPAEGAAQTEVLAALLRSNPVSTFISTPDNSHADTGDFYLVTDLVLGGSTIEPTVAIGDEVMGLDALGGRLSALIDAFRPDRRQIAFVRIADPGDLLPTALPGLRSALEGAGIATSVLMVGDAAGSCGGARAPLHYAILAGLADRAPFGDGDRITTAAEALGWAEAALARDVARGAPCAARYSLILRGDEDPRRPLASHGATPLIPEMESAVYTESFEALFLLTSDDPAPIAAFLQSCIYCPNEAELTVRLRDIGEREMALRLETGVWEQIRDDASPARLRVYLENCQLCAYRDDAEERIATLEARAAAREAEALAFEDLAAARDLAGLRAWVADCVACDRRAEAEALIAGLESDAETLAEETALDSAISLRNAAGIRAWLEGCTICGGRERAEEALAQLDREAAAAGPCLAAAGLPQQGGPRLLAEIDQVAARDACMAMLGQFPGSPVALTAMGRVDQAAGDLDAARAAYRQGIEAGLPQAYGLAAHLNYAPGEGATADYAEAARLAEQGLALGDWLSGEVLTVLYSRELVEGKGPEDAFAIAQAQAAEGNPVAQFFAGYFNRIGAGTPQDTAAAVAWYEQAVAQGYVHANSFLAEILETGADGIEADPLRAADLYWQALVTGDPTARDRLAGQIADRTPDVVREIQARLREAGTFNGRVDGIGGPNTASAVDRYVAVLAELAEAE